MLYLLVCQELCDTLDCLHQFQTSIHILLRNLSVLDIKKWLIRNILNRKSRILTAKCVCCLLTAKHHAEPDVTGYPAFGARATKSYSTIKPCRPVENSLPLDHARASTEPSFEPGITFSMCGVCSIFQISMLVSDLHFCILFQKIL